MISGLHTYFSKKEIYYKNLLPPLSILNTKDESDLINNLENKFDDIYTIEDAEYLMKAQVLPIERIKGVETGGCPHTAVREDPSINLSVIEQIESEHTDLDLIIIESGGDNITTTFSPALADYFIYIVDVSGGDKYPRKGGLGIETSDLLVINKIDLAPSIGADLSIMERDAKIVRKNKPYVLVNCKTDQGVETVAQHLIHDVLFDQPPKNMITQVKS